MTNAAARLVAVAALLAAGAASAQEEPVRHEFTIADFATEGGVVLPEARVAYGT